LRKPTIAEADDSGSRRFGKPTIREATIPEATIPEAVISEVMVAAALSTPPT
jgi:hypothetical protein